MQRVALACAATISSEVFPVPPLGNVRYSANELNTLGHKKYGEGSYAEASKLFRAEYNMRTSQLGSKDPATLTAAFYASASLDRSGLTSDALMFLEPILEKLRSELGEGSIETSHALLAYAQIIMDDRNDEVIPILEHCLSVHTREYGVEHEETLKVMQDLALALSNARRCDEAIEMEREILQMRIRLLGEKHQHTAITLSNLGVALGRAGRKSEALEHHKKSLSIKEIAFGPNHPEYFVELVNLGFAYTEVDRFDEAESLFRRGTEGFVRTLGRDHRDVKWAAGNLRGLLQRQSRQGEAEEIVRAYSL